MKRSPASTTQTPPDAWRRYVVTFMGALGGLLAAAYLFILLLDPFGTSAISLPLERPFVTVQRYMYPRVVRSGRYDSLIVGTSTSMLLDPQNLDGLFHARFANVAMASATAWEQKQIIELFLRQVKRPKALVIGLDTVWCARDADRNRITFRGFPEWLYDDNRWNDYLHLLDRISFMSAMRVLRFQVGLFSPTMRSDGMEVFLPPDSEYDLARARQHIYGGDERDAIADRPVARPLSEDRREEFTFPGLTWLDEILSRLPDETIKILAFMPTHISTVGDPQIDACKTRVAEIGRRRGASVIDWRIPSAITREDSNFWDRLHYRVAIANRIARDLAAAALQGKASNDGTYVLLVHKD